MMSKHRNFGLDLLRAIAILLVIASHMKRQLIVGGHLGVELFFVLSGFLIGGIFLRQIVTTEATSFAEILRFWKRRWWRTLPNYLLFLVLFAVADLAFGRGISPKIGAYFLFLQNFAWPTFPFYFISWSLAVEEWFYLLMPLAYLVCRTAIPNRRNAFFAMVFAIFAGATVLRFTVGAHLPYDTMRQTVVYRLDAMMVGVVCAALSLYRPEAWGRARMLWPIGVLGLVTLAFLNHRYDAPHLPIPPALTFSLAPILSAMLLPALSAWSEAPERIRKPVEFLAVTSYSAYLCHYLVLEATDALLGAHPSGKVQFLAKGIAVVAIFAIAALNYRFFERPLTGRRGAAKPNEAALPGESGAVEASNPAGEASALPRRRKGGLKVLLVALVSAIALTEVTLRVMYGLGNPPLYEADAQCGYRAVPSRHYRRFENEYTVNAFSQRSSHDPRTKLAGVTRVLCVGDSITNGGAPTDDRATYPEQLEADLNAAGKGRWEVLNASTGGWAPANELGYLQEFGTSQADIVVLQVATHDLYQPFAPSSTAGTRTFPTTPPFSAIYELLDRYLLPRWGLVKDPPDPGAALTAFTSDALALNQKTVASEIDVVRRAGVRPIVWYVCGAPGGRQGNPVPDPNGYDALKRQLHALKVPLFDFTSELDGKGGDALFRDGLHPNPAGDQAIARAMAERLFQVRAEQP